MLKITLFGAALLLSMPALAQAEEALPAACLAGDGHMSDQIPGMAGMPGLTEMQKAYMQGMDKMHAAMMTGVMANDPDVAFVCGMIPHHQGAIDMAKVELQYGKDPWVRELSQKIIDAQTAELADMRKWLDTRGK